MFNSHSEFTVSNSSSISDIAVYLAAMASNALLDRLNCTFNRVSFADKAQKLMEIRDVCIEALSADLKAKRGIQHEVFVCNFAQLQFLVSEQLTDLLLNSISYSVRVEYY